MQAKEHWRVVREVQNKACYVAMIKQYHSPYRMLLLSISPDIQQTKILQHKPALHGGVNDDGTTRTGSQYSPGLADGCRTDRS